MKGKDGMARAMYVTATGERLVVVHAFVKKTQTYSCAIETTSHRILENRFCRWIVVFAASVRGAGLQATCAIADHPARAVRHP